MTKSTSTPPGSPSTSSRRLSDHDNEHPHLPPLPNIIRSAFGGRSIKRKYPSSSTTPSTTNSTSGPQNPPPTSFNPIARSSSRLSNRSVTTTFIDAPGTITVASDLDRVITSASTRRKDDQAQNQVEKNDVEKQVETPISSEADKEVENDPVVPNTDDDFPDGGKEAWLVVLGGVCALFCGFGLTAALGGFQTFYTLNYLKDVPVSQIAWITGMQAFMTFGLAAFTGSLFDKYGHRPLVLVGTILSGVGLIILSFCTQYYQLFLVHTLPIGIGNNLIFISPMGVVGQWFKKRRGLAFGLLTSGASLGSLCWPLVIAAGTTSIGFPWTMRIMGIMTFFLGTCAFFLLKGRLGPKPRGPFFYFVAFRKISYLCVCFSSFTYVLGFFSFLTFIGTFANLTGLGSFSPYLLVITNGASAFGRISLGVSADYLGPYNVTTISILLMAILYWAWMSIRSLSGLIAFAILFGYFSGAYVSLQAPMAAAEADDMRYAGTMVGQVLFFMSFAQLFGGPIFGALLGTGSPEEQLANANKAIAMGASMMTLTAILLGIGKLSRNRKIFGKA